jgi:3-oxoacyl-[acyl-carrier-protein] synthase III
MVHRPILGALKCNTLGMTMNFHTNLRLDKSAINDGLGTKIHSVGIYIPERKVTSEEIFDFFDSEDKYGVSRDWMSTEMGIFERRMCDENALPSDLAIAASRDALDGIDRDKIDVVIFCGIERDQPEPATAHRIQKELGLTANYAFDMANACFGFFDGMRVASSLIQSKAARNVLVTTGEVPTKVTRRVMEQLKKGIPVERFRDQIGFLSVGDAGGAVVIGESRDGGLTGFRSFEGRTLSKYNDLCHYKEGSDGEIHGQMKMAKIVARTIRLQEDLIHEAQRSKMWRKPKFLMTHQVGKKAFDQVASMKIVPRDRMIKSYDYFGNVTSATFAVNYYQLMRDDRLKRGDDIYACYNGSGIVAGQTAWRH